MVDNRASKKGETKRSDLLSVVRDKGKPEDDRTHCRALLDQLRDRRGLKFYIKWVKEHNKSSLDEWRRDSLLGLKKTQSPFRFCCSCGSLRTKADSSRNVSTGSIHRSLGPFGRLPYNMVTSKGLRISCSNSSRRT